MDKAIFIVAAALLWGCSKPVEGYAVSVDDAYRRLMASDMEGLKMGRQCGILIHFQPSGTPNKSVTWQVTSSGREMVRFTVDLVPAGEGRTKFSVTMPPDEHGQEPYAGGQFRPRPAFNQPLRPAIEEQIAALLEGRDYSWRNVPTGTDSVCNVQRAGLEEGHRFSINDDPGSDSAGTAQRRRAEGAGWGEPSGGWGK